MKASTALQILTLFITISTIEFAGCGVGEWIEVNCPEKKVSTRLPRDPATAYLHYASMYESGYRASEAALDSIIPDLSPADTLKMIATDFKRYLGAERSSVQTQLQSAVARLQDNPCDDDARRRFQYLIQYVNFNGNYLHKIAAASKESSSNLRIRLEEYRREKNEQISKHHSV